MRTLALAVLFVAALVYAGDYALGPDSQPHSGVPRGSVAKYELNPAGTPHTYSIYVPAQYDAAKPTPLMIFLDGDAFLIDKVRVPVVLDNTRRPSEAAPGALVKGLRFVGIVSAIHHLRDRNL